MSDLLPFVVVGLVSGSVYGLAGVGLVLTYKTSGIFNFAHGTIAAAVAFAFYDLRVLHGVPWPIAAFVCLFVLSPAIGFGLERLARRITTAEPVYRIIATLGLVVAIQQIAIIRYGAATRPFPPFLPTGDLRVIGVVVSVDQIIVMAIALVASIGLLLFFRSSRLGREMRAVVDNPDLVALTGTNPMSVRRWAWCIGSGFAGMSGILVAPAVGLDAGVLTLLVVQAFGAAAVGLFRSLPLTYLGGLIVGVAASLSTKYVGSVSWLAGFPPSVPFVVLFGVLVAVPRGRLAEVGAAHHGGRAAPATRRPRTLAGGLAALCGLGALVLVPSVVGAKLPIYTTAMAFVLLFLSLALLVRMSGQVSLAQLGFAAVGASAFAHLANGGLPWLLAVLAAGLLAAPVGALVAIPAIRLSGLYLALATLGFGLLLERLVYQTKPMFGGSFGYLRAPRPSFATSDTTYYFVVLLFVVAGAALVAGVHRSRLGRLLRGLADSPLALSAYGTNNTVIKVMVFVISAFIAGVAGALLGPVTGTITPVAFNTNQSLLIVVVLMLQPATGELRMALGAAAALVVVPAYVDSPTLNEYFPVLFGAAAIAVAAAHGRGPTRSWAIRASANAQERLESSPVRTRLEELRGDAVPAPAAP